MTYPIIQNALSKEIKQKIFQGFSQQALKIMGMDGLGEEPISFEIYDKGEFIGAIVVQLFWEQLHIKYLFVDEKYRGRGLARRLMDHALEYATSRGCHFAFVETMSFQAPKFYKKLGFEIEFSRDGYAKNTSFHYLKKSLIDQTGIETPKQMTRTGVYGIAEKEGKILLIKQKRGPFAGKLDFPGGGLEFGESVEQALRREFSEETAMEFDSMQLLLNLTDTIDVPRSPSNEAYTFYQIGMLYQVEGYKPIKHHEIDILEHVWADLRSLSEDQCSKLLWKYKRMQS